MLCCVTYNNSPAGSKVYWNGEPQCRSRFRGTQMSYEWLQIKWNLANLVYPTNHQKSRWLARLQTCTMLCIHTDPFSFNMMLNGHIRQIFHSSWIFWILTKDIVANTSNVLRHHWCQAEICLYSHVYNDFLCNVVMWVLNSAFSVNPAIYCR